MSLCLLKEEGLRKYSNGELATLTNPHSETTSWTFDSYGRMSRQTLSTGSYTDYGFDSRGRTTSIVHKNSSNTVLTQEAYSFDPVGNMLSKTGLIWRNGLILAWMMTVQEGFRWALHQQPQAQPHELSPRLPEQRDGAEGMQLRHHPKTTFGCPGWVYSSLITPARALWAGVEC